MRRASGPLSGEAGWFIQKHSLNFGQTGCRRKETAEKGAHRRPRPKPTGLKPPD